ncbi:MAG TPA: hypothetical protein VGC97_04645 [Pyrinomonadaceae bacterium]|jgi:hypothetical protein
MNITNLANLSENEFAALQTELAEHKTLGQVLAWASRSPKSDFLPRTVAEVVTQDEFTHDASSFRTKICFWFTTRPDSARRRQLPFGIFNPVRTSFCSFGSKTDGNRRLQA